MGHHRTTEETGDAAEPAENVTPETSPLCSPDRPVAETKGRIDWPRFGQYKGFKVTIVHAAWNRESVSHVARGCEEMLRHCEVDVTLLEVPGANDLVAGAKAAAAQKPHAIVCVGVFVQGWTESALECYSAAMNGLQALNAAGDGPVICGIQFCKTEEHAKERCTAELGGEWAKSALQMCSLGA